MSDDVRVGVLALHNSKETKAICNAVDALGHTPVWLRRENTTLAIEDGAVGLDPDVDVVANRLLLSSATDPVEGLGLAAALARLRPTLNPPEPVLVALHKFATATTLADRRIAVPDAFLALSNDGLDAGRDRFAPVGVYKTAIGTHGGGTWKVDLDRPVDPLAGERQAFLQEFVERDGGETRDLRVYVVDDEVVAAMYRYAPPDDFRTNVALGGEAVDATDDLPPAAAETALSATAVVGLDYAGVDLVEDDEGVWRVLEVNPTAGFRGLFAATGRNPAPHIARLAIETGGGAVPARRVSDLAGTLDDSVPDCRPPRSGDGPATTPVIGYVEEVVVAGTTGSKRVLAKSDTGATRTSVDTALAASVGAGPIRETTRVRSGSVQSGKSRPVVTLVVGIDGRKHVVAASVEDRSHMDYPLLIGRDVLEGYRVDVRRRADGPDAEE